LPPILRLVKGRFVAAPRVLIVALTCAAAAVVLALTGAYALRQAPLGYTSRWQVPTSTVYHGLRYSLAKPVACRSRSAVERSYGRMQQLPSDLGFARFTADARDQPVFLWLVPKGHSCVVLYAQYQEVG
jgi:hypothetical protein